MNESINQSKKRSELFFITEYFHLMYELKRHFGLFGLVPHAGSMS